MVRLQRVLADAGVAARRQCEKLIEDGRVEVNGEVRDSLPVFVDPAQDRISVDGRPIPRIRTTRKIYLMLHKPERTLVTAADEEGVERRTIMSLVDHPSKPRLFPVGRLDFESTGLVLLTNDGEIANVLSHPRFGVEKVYHAMVKRALDDTHVADLEGVMNRAGREEAKSRGRLGTPGVQLSVVRREPGRTLLAVTMRAGANRAVRDVLANAGCPVKKLTQVRLGPLELKGVALSQWRELTRDEVRALRQVLSAARRGRIGGTSNERDAAKSRGATDAGAKSEQSTADRSDDGEFED
ncbi:MAG: rRNA pseudouridine synthase [Phycisphaerae bacterium]|nr:rRNA pseudouridine synthase [Phycisphaerae bacterium]